MQADDTALTAAAQNGHNDVVKTLLKHGADIEARGGVCNTLSQLIVESDYRLLDCLLILTVAPFQDDYTALMWATQNNHIDVVRTLLSHGADVNVTNDVRMNEAWH